jgi:hypothetical protein
MATAGFKSRQNVRDLLAGQQALLTDANFLTAGLGGAMTAAAPGFNAILAQLGMAGQVGASGIMANFARAGLGQTGLGGGLAGGLRGGLGAQGSMLRGRMLQDLLAQVMTDRRLAAQTVGQAALAQAPAGGGFQPGFFEGGGLGQQMLGAGMTAAATALGGPAAGAGVNQMMSPARAQNEFQYDVQGRRSGGGIPGLQNPAAFSTFMFGNFA